MSHWTHFVTEADIAPNVAPEHEVFHFSFNNPEALRSEIIEMLAEEDEDIAIAEAWEAERVALCNADNDAARNDIPVPEGFDKALEEAQEQRAQWLDQQEALERLEREARRAELKGLMVCGDDEWGRR